MDLASLEAMCEVVVKGGSSPDAFARANAQVIALQSDVANIPTLQAIFSSSTSSSAILVAARCLQTLVTEHWTSFTEAQRVEIRDYLLNFLAQKGPLLETFAMMAVVSLVVQITKLGWLDAGEGIRTIVDECKKFLQATVQHCAIGLRLLNDLVTQMNYKSKNRSMTLHRKVAVSFKDAALFAIFEISLTMLNQVATRSIALEALPPDAAARTEDKITEESLSLLIACMSFDFLGSNPDEDAADTTSVQVPASWRERLQSGSTLRVLFNLYKGCTTGRIPLIPDAPAPAIAGSASAPAASRGAFGSPAGAAGGFGGASSAGGGAGGAAGGLFGYKPFSGIAESGAAGAAPTRDMRVSPARASQCLDALNLMVAVRRSLFASDGDRRRFLSYVLRGVCDILREEAGFAHEGCFHNFAKLLGKIKTSFQLAELVAAEGYAEWIALTAAFTIKCCGQPVWAGNSMHFILGLWTRLVSSVPYMQAEFASRSGMGMGMSGSSMMGMGGAGMLAARVAGGLSASAAAALAAGGGGSAGGASHPDVVFDAHIPRIVQAYVRGRLDALAATAASAGASGGAAAAAAAESNREEVLAQLDDLEVIEDELEQLPAIARYTYEASHAAVTGLMDPLLTRYSEGLSFLAAAPPGADISAALAALRMLECQLAWLVAVAGSIIGGAGSGSGYASITGAAYYGTAFSGGGAGASDGRMAGSGAGGSSPVAEEHLDGELARRVMTLMTMTDGRISRAAAGAAASGGSLPPSTMAALRVDSRLELAFVHFLSNFRRAYVNEQGGLPSLALGTATAAAAAAKVVGAPMGGAGGASAGGGGLLSDISSSAAGGGTGGTGAGGGAAAMAGARSAAEARAIAAEAVRAEAPSLQELYAAATGRQRVFLGLVIRMGMGDHTVVVSLMITKLANNLRFWPERPDLVDRTLDVLNELIFSYSSGRLLLSLDVISGLLSNHGEASFPFLASPGMVRQRTLFHAALARLVFMEDESDKFEPFMAPLLLTLERLAPAVAAGVRTEEVMVRHCCFPHASLICAPHACVHLRHMQQSMLIAAIMCCTSAAHLMRGIRCWLQSVCWSAARVVMVSCAYLPSRLSLALLPLPDSRFSMSLLLSAARHHRRVPRPARRAASGAQQADLLPRL